MRALNGLAADLARQAVSSRTVIEACIRSIDDPAGEGSRAFRQVDRDGALARAQAWDRLRAGGAEVPAYAGIPVSVKDLFDVRGQVTAAGSRVLAQSAAAQRDCTAVARLRAAGFVIIGRTNMTEFAYSGLGLNPHYGTPLNPFDRQRGRIPGGSSSGAAVSVADGMCTAALGTDTGGSCRIPAALCGLVGFKPTTSRIPRDGMIPLSTSFDSVGTVAPSVRCCMTLDRILAGGADAAEASRLPVRGLRIGVIEDYVLADVSDYVAGCFERALSRLSAAGAVVTDVSLPELNELPVQFARGGLTAAEAWAWHESLISERAAEYDPRVARRILKGRDIDAAEYIHLLQARRHLTESCAAVMAAYDVVAMPTVPVIAPSLAELDDDADYDRLNLMVLRNPMVANVLDRCAVSLPMHDPGEAPAGLMLMGESGADARLLAAALEVETVLRPGGDL